MATPLKQQDNSSDSSEADETLDPLSPLFDPMKALYSNSVKLPVPNAKQFNNLSEFENYMRGRDAKTFANKKEQRPKLPGMIAERAANQAREAVRKAALTAKYQGATERSQTQLRKQRVTTVLTRMENYEKGPLSLLQRCVKERLRVVVIIRAAVTVKSRCRGYLIAFDKHLNMALMDVDETFLKPVKKEKPASYDSKEEVEMLTAETQHLNFTVNPTSSNQRTQIKTEMPSPKLEKGSDRSDDLRVKLAKRAEIKSSVPLSCTSSSQKKTKEPNVKTESHPKACSYGAFWTAYKPWAEQRCYTTYEIVERHVNQLFLRGDNVVSVILDQG